MVALEDYGIARIYRDKDAPVKPPVSLLRTRTNIDGNRWENKESLHLGTSAVPIEYRYRKTLDCTDSESSGWVAGWRWTAPTDRPVSASASAALGLSGGNAAAWSGDQPT